MRVTMFLTTIAIMFWQSATNVYPDIGYILGIGVTLLTLLGGFAKLVSQNTRQASQIEALTKTVLQ